MIYLFLFAIAWIIFLTVKVIQKDKEIHRLKARNTHLQRLGETYIISHHHPKTLNEETK